MGHTLYFRTTTTTYSAQYSTSCFPRSTPPQAGEAEVKLDANNMLAGKKFTIELELVALDPQVCIKKHVVC